MDAPFRRSCRSRAISDAALSSRIKAARRLIGDEGTAQRCIRTIHGRGFRFVANVIEADRAPVVERSVGDATAPEIAPHPATRYAKSGDVHVAYHFFGNGPFDFVLAPAFVSHIDNYWDDPHFNRWLTRLRRLARVDISAILPTIQAPTLVIHRTEDVLIDVEGGRYLAERIPHAQYVELPDVIASTTVKNLVAGSHLAFEDYGEQSLSDIEGVVRLYRVSG